MAHLWSRRPGQRGKQLSRRCCPAQLGPTAAAPGNPAFRSLLGRHHFRHRFAVQACPGQRRTCSSTNATRSTRSQPRCRDAADPVQGLVKGFDRATCAWLGARTLTQSAHHRLLRGAGVIARDRCCAITAPRRCRTAGRRLRRGHRDVVFASAGDGRFSTLRSPPPSSGSAAAARFAPRGLFALYVAAYSGFRIFEELLRVDPSHHILELRLNFFVATLLCIAGLTWFAATHRPHRLRFNWLRRRRASDADKRRPAVFVTRQRPGDAGCAHRQIDSRGTCDLPGATEQSHRARAARLPDPHSHAPGCPARVRVPVVGTQAHAEGEPSAGRVER